MERASSKLATFAQAISRIHAETPSRIHSGTREVSAECRHPIGAGYCATMRMSRICFCIAGGIALRLDSRLLMTMECGLQPGRQLRPADARRETSHEVEQPHIICEDAGIDQGDRQPYIDELTRFCACETSAARRRGPNTFPGYRPAASPQDGGIAPNGAANSRSSAPRRLEAKGSGLHAAKIIGRGPARTPSTCECIGRDELLDHFFVRNRPSRMLAPPRDSVNQRVRGAQNRPPHGANCSYSG